MGTKFLTLMLVMQQFISSTAEPVHLCISKSGSVCVELDAKKCTCCAVADSATEVSEVSACCGHCETQESSEPLSVGIPNVCDCTHIPLMITQGESIRALVSTDFTFGHILPMFCLYHERFEVVPLLHSSQVLNWDRRIDPSCHPISLTTTILRC